jgi:hypothetical protein
VYAIQPALKKSDAISSSAAGAASSLIAADVVNKQKVDHVHSLSSYMSLFLSLFFVVILMCCGDRK